MTPDAVLKWVKSGKISAAKTRGGHFRISRRAIPADLIQGSSENYLPDKLRSFIYCWEFYSINKQIKKDCRRCTVYLVKARRCYDMTTFQDIGHEKKHCVDTCDNCDYYKLIINQKFNVLVVTQRDELQSSLVIEL